MISREEVGDSCLRHTRDRDVWLGTFKSLPSDEEADVHTAISFA